MADTIYSILSVDEFTIWLVAAISAACAMLLYLMTESRLLTIVFTPMSCFAALTGIWLSNELGLYYSGDRDSNIALGALIGLIFSAVVIVLAVRFTFMIVNWLTPTPVNNRTST